MLKALSTRGANREEKPPEKEEANAIKKKRKTCIAT